VSRPLRCAGALALVCFGVLTSAWVAPAMAEPALPAGFQDSVVFSGIEQPVAFRFAPDGRVFVAEKPGKILVYEDLEDTKPKVFADLRGDVYDTGDRGLLGIALDPEFDEGRPYVYALYTWDHVLGEPWDPEEPEYGTPGVSGDPGCPSQNSSASCLVSGRLVRLTEDPLKPNHALEEGGLPKEEELLQGWCQQFSSHSIGDLKFGPEGALYVSGGDGAAYESIPDYGQLGKPPNPCGDPPTPKGTSPEISPGVANPEAQGGALRAQNLKVLNGAILRVDPDTGEALADNPLAASSDENTRRTIAKGFRNPFRFTLEPEGDTLYTDNVGSSEIEELDRFAIPPSSLFNSGWPCYEGPEQQFQFKTLGLDICKQFYEAEKKGLEPTAQPFFYYSHGQSVVPEDECPIEYGSALGGISFYDGEEFPAEYKGALFFTDAVRGCVWVMFRDEGHLDPSTTTRFLRESRIYPAVDIEEGPEGALFYADLFGNEEFGDGAIHKITYSLGAPTARLSANPPFGEFDAEGKFKATLDASASTDPQAETLKYDWDLDGNGSFETENGGKTRTFEFTQKELEEREENEESPNSVVAVRVTDGEGHSSIARVTVYPGDSPPVPAINEPSASATWGVESLIKLHGSGTDSEEVSEKNPSGSIFTPLSYYWSTRILHCPNPSEPTKCHAHPLQIFAGTRSGEFTAPEHEYPSYIEITLRVADKRGLTAAKTIKLEPRTVNLSIASSPPGIEVTAGLQQGPSPLSLTAIEGSHLQLSAPATAQIGGKTYTWQSWSDGGGRTHTVHATQSGTITAAYTTPEGKKEVPPSPPATRLIKHPPKSTRSTTAKFAFRADLAGATFRCKLDRKPTQGCRSPKVYKRLKPGRHTFKVWAVASGITDPTPAKFGWKVLPKR
jgi:YD repeat-containing protein